MDRQLILNSYIQAISKETDNLREAYPKAMSREIIEMEKGYRYCTTKSVEWLENFLKIIEAATASLETGNNPIATHTSSAIQHTNNITDKKKKTFFQVAGEASKDMMGDLWKAGTKKD